MSANLDANNNDAVLDSATAVAPPRYNPALHNLLPKSDDYIGDDELFDQAHRATLIRQGRTQTYQREHFNNRYGR